jgi:RNA polymerase sigma-70 factor (ECF subfamily)
VKAPPITQSADIEALVHEHQGALRGYLTYLGCPRNLVDDQVQETFLTFLSAEFEHRGTHATASYLRTIARHLFLKGLRRKRLEPPSMDMSAAEELWAEHQVEDSGAGYLEALRSCFSGLDAKVRETLNLRYGSSLGRGAIADQLDLSESGVHSILVRARRRLRSCIERRLEA